MTKKGINVKMTQAFCTCLFVSYTMFKITSYHFYSI